MGLTFLSGTFFYFLSFDVILFSSVSFVNGYEHKELLNIFLKTISVGEM